MCNGMHVSHVGFGECAPGVEGSVQHIAARVYVGAVLVSSIYVLKNQFHREESILARPVSSRISDISLHCMGQGIHTRSGSDKRRQT